MTVDAAQAAEQQAEQVQAADLRQPQSHVAQKGPEEQQAQSGPQAATERQQSEEERQEARNALQANIQEKREQSYYYAHAPRATSEEPAPPPVHVVLERAVVEVPPVVVTIFNYAWADEGDVVKVYIPLEGVGAQCSDDDIKTTFEARMMQVDVHGFRPKQVHRLLLARLSADVAPEECRVRKLANKVVVSLKKAAGSSHKWYNLSSSV